MQVSRPISPHARAVLADAGFEEQVHTRQNAALVFFHPDAVAGPRYRLVRARDGWETPAGSVSQATLLELLSREPLRFSSSALLRPLVQDAILPDVRIRGRPSRARVLRAAGSALCALRARHAADRAARALARDRPDDALAAAAYRARCRRVRAGARAAARAHRRPPRHRAERGRAPATPARAARARARRARRAQARRARNPDSKGARGVRGCDRQAGREGRTRRARARSGRDRARRSAARRAVSERNTARTCIRIRDVCGTLWNTRAGLRVIGGGELARPERPRRILHDIKARPASVSQWLAFRRSAEAASWPPRSACAWPRAVTSCCFLPRSRRLGSTSSAPRVSFRRVAHGPLPFAADLYPVALASALADAAREGFDVIHAHYALPHAAAALLARAMLRRARSACRDSSSRCTARTSPR